ncbi:homoserine O-acetyltransferase [Alteromonadaceae bacterium BrNp21-10]|nr:homoserine O-acetyltransferase [Alteromonadaceae bacterium BrNp21-10]
MWLINKNGQGMGTRITACIGSRLVPILLCLCISPLLHAAMLVEKQRFEIPTFSTFGGKTINNVQVGWESYGQLNADKSNVILITHYFTGNSHAAGKYAESDQQAGYWDYLIGPGKTIDTNKFFVISVDSLANVGVHNPNVITTGPASINPQTGKAYGLTFPVVTIRDFVNVQKALLESLGIQHLHAVIGASMGSMQALDWALAYPDWVERLVSVIGTGESDAWTTLQLQQWATPIRLDKNWNNGDYYASTPPIDGLTAVLMSMTQVSMHPQAIARLQPNHQPLEAAPLQDINANHKVVDWLHNIASARAKEMDANHVLYLVRANQLFVGGHQQPLVDAVKRIKAKSLIMPASNDLLLMPYQGQALYNALINANKNATYQELEGDMGHLTGVTGMAQQAALLQQFLLSEDSLND